LLNESLLPCERIDELLPEQVEVCATSTCGFYGDEDDTDGLYHSKSPLVSLYARVKNKR